MGHGRQEALSDSAAYPKLMGYAVVKVYCYMLDSEGETEKDFLASLTEEIISLLPPKGVEPYTASCMHD